MDEIDSPAERARRIEAQRKSDLANYRRVGIEPPLELLSPDEKK